MISYNQKSFQLCFVRNSPRGGRASRASFTQNENPARVRRVGGRVPGNPHLVVYEGLLLRGLRFANSRARPKLPHVETILLIVILAFAAGFVLDRLAVRRGRFDAAKSKKEQ